MPATSTQLIRFGHSPDPDDAFMFYALNDEKVPMRGFRVEHVIEDIETLNQRAMQTGAFQNVPPLEVTAVSCHAYAYLTDRYAVMRSGASVGNKYGPILVARDKWRVAGKNASHATCHPSLIKGKRIAVPGKMTTAYLALQLFEKDFEPIFIPFDQIFEAVEKGIADIGLVIHEGQITYEERGFQKVVDLGEWWHEKTQRPLPLGIDIIRRDLGKETMKSFAQLFRESIEYALAHREPALEYALQYGRGITKKLNDQFVGMYVNEDTVELSRASEEGLRLLLEEGYQKGILPHRPEIEFI